LRLIFIPFVIINVVDDNYGWALGLFIAAGISDGLDGLLARWLKQQTLLGEYLDPIADKLLLSSLFLVLSFEHLIRWKYTVLVFTRDIGILLISAVLYAAVGLRDFRPSIFGKVNTFLQVLAVFLVLLDAIEPVTILYVAKVTCLWLVFAFTLISALHYMILVNQRLKTYGQVKSSAANVK
jgi:cardiolipin synthase